MKNFKRIEKAINRLVSGAYINNKNYCYVYFVDSFVAEFKAYARRTAEKLLEIGRVVSEMKNRDKKKPKDFESFFDRISFKQSILRRYS